MVGRNDVPLPPVLVLSHKIVRYGVRKELSSPVQDTPLPILAPKWIRSSNPAIDAGDTGRQVLGEAYESQKVAACLEVFPFPGLQIHAQEYTGDLGRSREAYPIDGRRPVLSEPSCQVPIGLNQGQNRTQGSLDRGYAVWPAEADANSVQSLQNVSDGMSQWPVMKIEIVFREPAIRLLRAQRVIRCV